MFKKCVPSGSHTQLSKSDAKKLRKAAAETMGVDETLLESSGLMPPKSDVVVGKLEQRQSLLRERSASVLRPERQRWADPTDGVHAVGDPRGDASRHRHLQRGLPEGPGRRGPDVARLHHVGRGFDGDGETSQWAETSFAAGDVLALRARGNPHAFAIGEMAVSKAEAEACGMKGRGLRSCTTTPTRCGRWGTSPRRANRFARSAFRVARHSSPVPDEAPREAHEATACDAPTTRLETLRLSDDDDRGVEAAPRKRRRRRG